MTAKQSPMPPRSKLTKFDHLDLQKICEFLQEHTGQACKVVQGWYAADLGKKANKATVCIDIDSTVEDKTHPTAVLIYNGPREEDRPYMVALGKVKSVEFIEDEKDIGQPQYFVVITDEAGTIARISATTYIVISPAYTPIPRNSL